MNEIANRSGFHQSQPLTIEDMLKELYAVSFPDLYCSEATGTWSAKATMRVKVQGAEFIIRSEHRHNSPSAALAQLLDRTRAAIKQLGSAQVAHKG